MRGDVHIADVVHELDRANLLPCIVFRTSRAQCDVDAERAATRRDLQLSVNGQRDMRQRVRELAQQYEMDLELIVEHQHYNALVTTGIGAHHAGQLLSWRLLLEELMSEGSLRVLVATGTVAAGVDFPARSVVITAHSKRGAEGFNDLSAAEFQQMSGRAGRRGKDTVGFCIVAPAPFCDAREVLKISKRPPEPLVSSYFPAASTVLNLLRYRNVDDLRFTTERSLAAFMDRRAAEELRAEARAVIDEDSVSDNPDREVKKTLKKQRRLREKAVELENQQRTLINQALSGLQQLGYVEQSDLSPKGFWAANLCTTLVLELGEIIESKMLDDLSAESLAAVVASLAGDPHRRYLESKQGVLKNEDIEKLTAILDRVFAVSMPGRTEKPQIIPAAAYTVTRWMHTETWAEFRSLLILTGVAEGDAARLITQTADHLNQITRLSETHRELAFRAEEAKRRILRPPLSEAINLDTL